MTKSRLPRLQASGEDKDAFTEILRRSFGLSPLSLTDLINQPTRKGFVEKLLERVDALLIDIGLESSPPYQVTLRVDRLRAQLFDGRHISLRGIVAKYGFLEDFPMELRVVSCDEERRWIQVELSDLQRNLLKEWAHIPFDRITAQDVLDSEVRSAVRRSGLERDLAAIEDLSLGTHSLICKLGTDGEGLVPKLGPHLRAARLFVFHPNSNEHAKAKMGRQISRRTAQKQAES